MIVHKPQKSGTSLETRIGKSLRDLVAEPVPMEEKRRIYGLFKSRLIVWTPIAAS